LLWLLLLPSSSALELDIVDTSLLCPPATLPSHYLKRLNSSIVPAYHYFIFFFHSTPSNRRQDVQEQLRQRFRHIVSDLTTPDAVATACQFVLTQPPHSSPQGRIFQVEYAAEAVKQGSVVVGIASKTHAVLVAIKVGYDDQHPSLIPHN
jgi:hypothetical protein